MGFHDIMDSGECPGHSYSGEQSIFNCPIAKFTVRFAAAAREGRVGVHVVLAPRGVISCPCCDLGSRKDQADQLSDAGLLPSSTPLNHSSCKQECPDPSEVCAVPMLKDLESALPSKVRLLECRHLKCTEHSWDSFIKIT